MNEQYVCAADELRPSGLAVRFRVRDGNQSHSAFAVRFGAGVYAYLNRCGHLELELDWTPGEVFDRQGTLLICATHGARYNPASGACRGGPCGGIGLIPLGVVECDGEVLLCDARFRVEPRIGPNDTEKPD